MAVAYCCMLIVILLPYGWVYVAKFGRSEDGRRQRYDNRSPRIQQAQLQGLPARALWAQNNAFESHPAFLAAVLAAIQTGVPAEQVNVAAVVYVVSRVLHGIFYLANRASARSTVWALGVVVVAGLLLQAVRYSH